MAVIHRFVFMRESQCRRPESNITFVGTKMFVLSEKIVKTNITKISLREGIPKLRTFWETPRNIQVHLKL